VTYGQFARGYSLSLVEPYLLDYRVALGLDFYQRSQLANNFVSYGTKTLGFSPRLGFQLREDLSLQVRYSITQQEVTLPTALANCNNTPGGSMVGNTFLPFNPTPAFAANPANGVDLAATAGLGCFADGEASLPVRKELANGKTLTSAVGYTLNYNTLDNNKNPTDGLLVDFRQDFAGVGGDVTYLKTAIDAKYFTPLVSDIVGVIHLQGGILNQVGNNQIRMLDHFQMGPNLVRGFAPNGIGPRDLNPFGAMDALGGTKYWGASYELQMPFWFLPKEVGLKGAVYADAGGLYDYKGPTMWTATNEITTTGCAPPTNVNGARTPGTCTGLVFDAGNQVRSSVGVGLIWASPFGPLRFDYAIPLTKGPNDRVQQFKFGGGTSF
jgi:outer membrane protein insertion porin family